MKQTKGQTPDYGNWVPAAMMKTLAVLTAVLLIVELLFLILLKNAILSVIGGILLVLVASFTVYMQRCRVLFDFRRGGLMGKVHQYLVDHLDWDGNGTLLDIGCGAGALTIRCARRFSQARITGMDYWGPEWSYAKEQCEQNARLEHVADRLTFCKGDAAALEFPDGAFDAAVSNFVFHEVRTQPDKRKVVREALLVVKKGGSFTFQDLFSQEKLYGNMEEFIRELKKEGIGEIHYIPFVEKQGFTPGFVQAPWMLHGIGLIYGKK